MLSRLDGLPTPPTLTILSQLHSRHASSTICPDFGRKYFETGDLLLCIGTRLRLPVYLTYSYSCSVCCVASPTVPLKLEQSLPRSLLLCAAELYPCPRTSCARFACRSASSSPRMKESPGIHRISVPAPWSARGPAASFLINRASCFPAAISRCGIY